MSITGKISLDSSQAEDMLSRLEGRIKEMRLVHPLERLAVAAAGAALESAGLQLPVGDSQMGIYLGIDDSIEDIKDEYFEGILSDGVLGASPLLFPLTSPNAISAQISIALQSRGENVTMPINCSAADVIEYATECVAGGYSKKALAGFLTIKDDGLSIHEGRYSAEFFVIESEGGSSDIHGSDAQG